MKLGSFTQKLDAFGTPIRMTFAGSDSFQTTCGGLITLALYIFVSILTINLFSQVVSKSDPDIKVYEISESTEEVFNLFENRMMIAVTF